MAGSDDEFRLRLEGRAELLEAARLRYRALLPMLRAIRWKSRLRRNAALLRETAAAQGAVDEALAAATRRARAEGWPSRAPMTRCLAEVTKLAASLARAAARRLPEGERTSSLGALLSRVEAEVVAGPRAVLPGQRWATALEVLPSSLREVRRAAAFGARLEPLFGRPQAPGGKMPFDAREAAALSARWAEGEAALCAVWERLGTLDPSGALGRYLQRRARRAPLHPPANGPEQLLHAEFWHGVARARLRELAEVRYGPVAAADGELLELVVYACAREADEGARLAANAPMTDGRAGLFELALELWYGLSGGGAGAARPHHDGESSWPPGTWERLLSRAHRADAGGPGDDFDRLRDTLRLFIRIRSREGGNPADRPLYRSLGLTTPAREQRPVQAETLASLVQQARALAEVPPLGRDE